MNLYEAREFIKEQHPDKEFTEEFNDSCLCQLRCNLVNGEIPLFSHGKYNKVCFVSTDGERVTVPIKNHIIPVDTLAAMEKLPKLKINVNPELVQYLKQIKKAKADGHKDLVEDDAVVLNDLKTKYKRTQEEIDKLVDEAELDEKDYNQFKKRNKIAD